MKLFELEIDDSVEGVITLMQPDQNEEMLVNKILVSMEQIPILIDWLKKFVPEKI